MNTVIGWKPRGSSTPNEDAIAGVSLVIELPAKSNYRDRAKQAEGACSRLTSRRSLVRAQHRPSGETPSNECLSALSRRAEARLAPGYGQPSRCGAERSAPDPHRPALSLSREAVA